MALALVDIERMKSAPPNRNKFVPVTHLFKSDEEKIKHFLNVIPATTKVEQVKAILELDQYRLLEILELSHNMVVAASTFLEKRKKRPSLLSMLGFVKSNSKRGLELPIAKELVDLKTLKQSWQVAFCEAYAAKRTRLKTSPTVFFRRLERVWEESYPLSLEDYLPAPKVF